MRRGPLARRAAAAACALAASAATAAALPAGASANTLETIALPAAHGEVSAQYQGYSGPAMARVLLPDNYDPNKAYPLLLLLHGFQNQYTTWTDPAQGDAQAVLNGLNAIVVMPTAYNSWYADWYNGGHYGDPAWEDYLLDEVLPQIQAKYKILPGRQNHAVVGVSMGGLGAAYIGGRLPGYFGTVGVISGFVDEQYIPAVPDFMSAVDGLSDLTQILGPPSGFYAIGHNPADLAANLTDTRVYMTAGNGVLSSRGTTSQSPEVGMIEEGAIIRPMSDNYARALQAAGVDFRYVAGAGIHDWPDFDYALGEMRTWGFFNSAVNDPGEWVNRTVAQHGQLWDIGYAFAAHPDGIVTFRQVGDQLSVTGASTALTVTTAGGCQLQLTEPATVTLPAKSCTAPKAKPKTRQHRHKRQHRKAKHAKRPHRHPAA